MIGRTPDSARRANIWLPVGRPAAARPASQRARRLPRSPRGGNGAALTPSQLGDGAGTRRQKKCRGPGSVNFQTQATGRSSDNCHHRDRASGGTGGTGADVGDRKDISGRRHAPHQHLTANRPADRRSSKHPAAARRTRRSPVCPSPYGGGDADAIPPGTAPRTGRHYIQEGQTSNACRRSRVGVNSQNHRGRSASRQQQDTAVRPIPRSPRGGPCPSPVWGIRQKSRLEMRRCRSDFKACRCRLKKGSKFIILTREHQDGRSAL